MNKQNEIDERIYAGVLGKLIGVYLGRPVEGWTYEKINQRFGEVAFYKSRDTGAPLIVPDDDISGTFAFYRAVEDNGYPAEISAKKVGDTWLNYIVENKTILWWGGLSRSTEHTAFLRLKAGIPAPKSGSVALNGRSMAEQIGAQIFIDTWAMMNPGDPDRAARMAREAASVSHGGIAVDAAVFLAAMEAIAFEEPAIDRILDGGLRYVSNDALRRLVGDIRRQCALTADWRQVRSWIAENHGYERYPGNCPMVTNHLVLLMAFILGRDDFHRSLTIACSAGWDTDCNSGNVGALNGIRLGLAGIDAGSDLRGPVADRMYLCTADGGECVTDAVRETRALVKARHRIRQDGQPQARHRFEFEFDGSTQGFVLYPDCHEEQALKSLGNARSRTGDQGLLLEYAKLGRGTRAVASVDTFVDLQSKGRDGTSYFEVICSPTLYGTQTVRAQVIGYEAELPTLAFFIDHFNEDDGVVTKTSPRFQLARGANTLEWEVPDTGGHPIFRLGVQLESEVRRDGFVVLRSLGWPGAPRKFEIRNSMEMTPTLTPWTTQTAWLKSFVSSAENLCPDYTTTFSISHPGPNGVVTTGTRDWEDYAVSSRITFSQQDGAGLVARSRGHRRYYAAVIHDGEASIVLRYDDEVRVLAATKVPFIIDETHDLSFRLEGDKLAFAVDGADLVKASDSTIRSGGAGFLVDSGAILGHRFTVTAVGAQPGGAGA